MEYELQQVIGTDKKNPDLHVLKDERLSKLYIYIGSVLYSTIDIHQDNRKNALLKIEIAKLFIAGVNQRVLKETFDFAISTMRRWAKAVKTGDIEIISAAISGPGAPRKVNPEIRRFIEVRFNEIYKTNKYTYSKIIRDEIETVYQITVTSETLRSIFNSLKEKFRQNLSSEISSDSSQKENEKEAINCDCSSFDIAENTVEPTDNKKVMFEEDHPEEIDNRNNSLEFGSNNKTENQILQGYAHHIGIMIFLPFINQIAESFHTGIEFLKQWIILLLLGVPNIEQSKHIDFNILETIFLNSMVRGLQKQRIILGELASDAAVIDSLILANAELLGVSSQTDFYFDPHSKHYTGEVNILKGWCGNLGKPGKALYMDFIHSSKGEPIYLEHFDNFDDLREIFFEIMANFRTKTEIASEQIITIVVDRAIFSEDFFMKILKEDTLHIITWEKNYRKDQWDDKKKSTSFPFHRFRNNSNDPLFYQFSFQEKSWAKNKNMRQLIVRATNPKMNEIEVSILTDDFDRNGKEIIILIFKRWLQENDFKYLIKHFGLDELVEYKSIQYEKLKEKIEDKQIKSGEYKALELKVRNLKKALKQVLYDSHITDNSLKKDSEELKRFQEESQNIDKKEKRKIKKRITNRITRASKKIPEIDEKIFFLEKEIIMAEAEKNEVEKKVSKLQEIIQKGKFRLVTPKKLLLDNLRIISRNIFYQAFQKFKIDYDNFRDDHEIFRTFSRLDGYIYSTKEKLIIILNPVAEYQPKVVRILDDYLSHFNRQNIRLENNSQKRIMIFQWKKKKKLFDFESIDIDEIQQELKWISS